MPAKQGEDVLFVFWLYGPAMEPCGQIWSHSVLCARKIIKRLKGKKPTALYPVEGYGSKAVELDCARYNEQMRPKKKKRVRRRVR